MYFFRLISALSFLVCSCSVTIDANEGLGQESIVTSNKVIVWGHSAGVIIEPFVKEYLEEDLDIDIEFEACSVNGETMLQVAARQGSIPPVFTNSTCIVNDHGYLVANNDNPFHSSYNNSAITFSITNGFNPCKVNGIVGQLSLIGSSYYFKPEDGRELILKGSNTVVSYASDEYRNALITIFWCDQGRDKDDMESLVHKYRIMTSFVGNDNYLIVGSITGTNDTRVPLETLLNEEFGEHYVSGRQILLEEAIKEQSGEMNADDYKRIDKGQLPSVYMADDIHLNEKASRILSKRIVAIVLGFGSVQDAIQAQIEGEF